MKLIRLLLISILFSFSSLAEAQTDIRFHCDQDTLIVNSLLQSPELESMSQPQRVAFFARHFVEAPSDLREAILEAEEAPLTVNVHSFNPLSLISSCLALAKAYETSSAPNWRDYADMLRKVQYKGGEVSDFVSRFLYGSDWIADNIFRGNVYDATPQLPLGSHKKERSIDYISHHHDDFAAFKDDAEYDRIKMLEMGFRNHQIPYVSTGDLINPKRFHPEAAEGDLIFLLAQDFNLDFREMGILLTEGNELLLLHVSPAEKKVMIDPLTLEQYVKRNVKRIAGARIVRVR